MLCLSQLSSGLLPTHLAVADGYLSKTRVCMCSTHKWSEGTYS